MKQSDKCNKQNKCNLLGHVGGLVSVADEPVLAVRQPGDVRDHQEARRNYHG